MVGMSVEAWALQSLNRYVITNNPTQEDLALVEQALISSKHEWSYDLPRVLDCEKLQHKNIFATFYETNSEGKIRLTRDPTAAIRVQFPDKVPPPTYWKKKLFKAYTVLSWFSMPSTPQKIGNIIDSSYERFYTMAERDYNWQEEPAAVSTANLCSTANRLNYRRMIRLLTRMQQEFFHSMHKLYTNRASKRRGTLIIIALRRYKNKHGNWPNSLDDIKGLTSPDVLIDPIDGGPFVYRRADDDFVLYSKGKDNIDNNGDYFDDLLIWPSRYDKYKEESDD
jgi:hypothetical protein